MSDSITIYCEAGAGGHGTPGPDEYFTDDPLWDGEQCTGDNQCCHDPGMVRFTRQFPSWNIEARICRDQTFSNEATATSNLLTIMHIMCINMYMDHT